MTYKLLAKEYIGFLAINIMQKSIYIQNISKLIFENEGIIYDLKNQQASS